MGVLSLSNAITANRRETTDVIKKDRLKRKKNEIFYFYFLPKDRLAVLLLTKLLLLQNLFILIVSAVLEKCIYFYIKKLP